MDMRGGRRGERNSNAQNEKLERSLFYLKPWKTTAAGTEGQTIHRRTSLVLSAFASLLQGTDLHSPDMGERHKLCLLYLPWDLEAKVQVTHDSCLLSIHKYVTFPISSTFSLVVCHRRTRARIFSAKYISPRAHLILQSRNHGWGEERIPGFHSPFS